MKDILIDTVPHADQRYDTPGDYWVDGQGRWHIRVSELGDWRYELLVTVHELVEMALCEHKGITQQEIDAFDIAFEQRRSDRRTADHFAALATWLRETHPDRAADAALCNRAAAEMDLDEPGDHTAAPYQREHSVATGVERILAALLDVKWKEYEAKVDSL